MKNTQREQYNGYLTFKKFDSMPQLYSFLLLL